MFCLSLIGIHRTLYLPSYIPLEVHWNTVIFELASESVADFKRNMQPKSSCTVYVNGACEMRGQSVFKSGLIVLISVCTCMAFGKPCFSQGNYTVLHNFSLSDGAGPKGSLTLSGSTLYVMTPGGGSNNDGTVFSLGTDLTATVSPAGAVTLARCGTLTAETLQASGATVSNLSVGCTRSALKYIRVGTAPSSQTATSAGRPPPQREHILLSLQPVLLQVVPVA